MNTPKSMAEINWNHDTEVSRDTGGYSIGFTLTVMQVLCLSSCLLNFLFPTVSIRYEYLCKDLFLFSFYVICCVYQSECQQLICEILRATPEAASADAAVQTARLANKAPSKEKRPVTVTSCITYTVFCIHFLLVYIHVCLSI